MEQTYVGTVWYHRSVPVGDGAIYRDTYTKKILRLSASGVQHFQDQVRYGHEQPDVQIEFGPIGPSWRAR